MLNFGMENLLSLLSHFFHQMHQLSNTLYPAIKNIILLPINKSQKTKNFIQMSRSLNHLKVSTQSNMLLVSKTLNLRVSNLICLTYHKMIIFRIFMKRNQKRIRKKAIINLIRARLKHQLLQFWLKTIKMKMILCSFTRVLSLYNKVKIKCQ